MAEDLEVISAFELNDMDKWVSLSVFPDEIVGHTKAVFFSLHATICDQSCTVRKCSTDFTSYVVISLSDYFSHLCAAVTELSTLVTGTNKGP